MTDDIVARLRAVLHNDRSVELMNREAADEIERLRAELRTYTGDKHGTREPFEPTEPFTPEAL